MKTTNIILAFIAIAVIIFIVWIGGSQKIPKAPVVADNQVTETNATTSEIKSETNQTKPMTTVVMTTNKGAITLELFGDKKPKTVENFVKLASEGFYNGT